MKKLKRIILYTLGILAVAAGVSYGLWSCMCHRSYEGEDVRVFIPAGASADAVEDTLQTRLGDFGARVATLWRFQGADPGRAHGSYVVSEGDEALAVARRISQGRQTPLRFTFNNLRTFGNFAARAGAVFEADSAAFAAVADTLLQNKGYAPGEFAAAILPDTYEFYWTAAPATVLTRLEDHRSRFWTGERLEKARQMGLTPMQVATLASIVEEETNKADERPTVARLYLNRLDRNMMLQADPTVKFAVGDFSLARITGTHLAVESPYNTYKVAGLPPGPIRIPEARTLDMVLDAPQHNYIYMCAKPDFSGYHNFAETYDRHRINAARYQRALSQRGIH